MKSIPSAITRALVLAVGLGVAGAGVAMSTPVHAKHKRVSSPDPRDAQIEALTQTVNALAAKVDALQARVAANPPRAQYTAAPPPPAAAPVQVAASPAPAPAPSATGSASIVAGKPSITSADGRFSANLHTTLHFDAADYSQHTPGPIIVDLRRGAAAADTARARDLNAGTNFRRARLGVDGKAFGDWDYNFIIELGGAGAEDAGRLYEGWVQYSAMKPFRFRIGAFQASSGLEDQGSTNGLLLLERSAVSDVARGLAAGDSRTAAQVAASGERWFAAAAVTGQIISSINSTGSATAQPFDEQLGFTGRVAYLPFVGDDWLVHVGAHGSYVDRIADTGGPDAALTSRYTIQLRERPELRVDGTRLIDTGALDARHASTRGLEFAAQKQNLFVQAEVEHIEVERRTAGLSTANFNGYYVEGSWIITGERKRYNTQSFAFDAPPVDHPFSLKDGTWGAFEIAARYSDLDLNYHAGAPGTAPALDAVRGGEQKIFGAGINWYPNSLIRFMLDYQDVEIDRLSPSAVAYATPVGAQIGQHYQAISFRSQFAF